MTCKDNPIPPHEHRWDTVPGSIRGYDVDVCSACGCLKQPGMVEPMRKWDPHAPPTVRGLAELEGRSPMPVPPTSSEVMVVIDAGIHMLEAIATGADDRLALDAIRMLERVRLQSEKSEEYATQRYMEALRPPADELQ